MPRGFMDDLEGEVANEEFHEGGFGDILSADLYGEDALLTNIGEHRVWRILLDAFAWNRHMNPLWDEDPRRILSLHVLFVKNDKTSENNLAKR